MGSTQAGLRTADVVLIFKKGDREVALNHRPVSFNKRGLQRLKIIWKQTEEFLAARNYISERKHGFRSCSTNILYKRIRNTLEKRDSWVAYVFLECEGPVVSEVRSNEEYMFQTDLGKLQH